MSPTKILVLGAGELGTSILTSLSALSPPSTHITVLLRPSTLSTPSPKQQISLSHLRTLGISFLPGDIASSTITQLSSLFTPYDTIISCLGFASGPGSQMKIATAVLDAKVKRFFPWQFGVDYDAVGRGSKQELWDEQLDVRDLLRGQSGTEWVIASTGLFMSFLFEPSFGVVDFDGGEGNEGVVVRALGSWENRVTVTDVDDIGRLTAKIVFAEPRVRNEVMYTAGETISYARLADVLEEVTGKGVKTEVWSVERLESELEEGRGMEEETVKKYRVAFAVGRGVNWDVERSWNWRNGVEVLGVKSYVEKNLPHLLEKRNV